MFNEPSIDMSPQNKHKRISDNNDRVTDMDSETECFTDTNADWYICQRMTLWFLYTIISVLERNKYCRLLLGISDLNYDLFRRHLLEDPILSCGYTAETPEHFILHCPLYNSIRNKTINKLDENEINISTFLFGNDQLHLETNKKIFAMVHDFLLQTDRL